MLHYHASVSQMLHIREISQLKCYMYFFSPRHLVHAKPIIFLPVNREDYKLRALLFDKFLHSTLTSYMFDVK
jgi:hypothetical protein